MPWEQRNFLNIVKINQKSKIVQKSTANLTEGEGQMNGTLLVLLCDLVPPLVMILRKHLVSDKPMANIFRIIYPTSSPSAHKVGKNVSWVRKHLYLITY